MTGSDNESQSTTTATFRFASDHILTLDEHQIEQIPYLCAMVSSADRFESARDEDGHFKLHPRIDYEHFSFVRHSLSFGSVRQLFTHLPKNIDVIPLLALLDFLGMVPQPDPDLNEVNSTFFSTTVYSTYLEEHLQITRPSVLQDIAVRFGIAMAKEEYDLTKCEVVDQIYWFVMFIMSAHRWFGPRLRHHIYTIAEHCFSHFMPSLLKSLKKLKQRVEEEKRRLVEVTEERDSRSDEEDNSIWEQVLYLDLDSNAHYYRLSRRVTFVSQLRGLSTRRCLLSRTFDYIEPSLFFFIRETLEKEPLKPVYERVLEIAYERLQTTISEVAAVELNLRTYQCELMKAIVNVPFSLYYFEYGTLPKRIDDIFTNELVQEEIRALILEELCIYTAELERRHVKLLENVRRYKEHLDSSPEDSPMAFLQFPLYNYHCLRIMEEAALSNELLLSKLHQNSSIVVEEMQRRVLNRLREVTLERYNEWTITQREINELFRRLKSHKKAEKSSPVVPKSKRHQYQIPVHKPLLNRQFKYSAR